jgi:deoxyribodipyrimidine photolyase
VPAEDIHNWSESYEKYKNIKYPKPMIDYLHAKKYALKIYAKIFS